MAPDPVRLHPCAEHAELVREMRALGQRVSSQEQSLRDLYQQIGEGIRQMSAARSTIERIANEATDRLEELRHRTQRLPTQPDMPVVLDALEDEHEEITAVQDAPTLRRRVHTMRAQISEVLTEREKHATARRRARVREVASYAALVLTAAYALGQKLGWWP
jgi:DNA repair exonuclease SbcCD ATPase subunit